MSHKGELRVQRDGTIINHIAFKQEKLLLRALRGVTEALVQRFPILITEKKNQGTNDLRALEGKKKQAKGNAIERLGKNVIGLRTALLNENIFPFICFGDGCDFAEGSSILDRVITIAMFGELNVEHLHNSPPFNRGTFYFRQEPWTEQEMQDISTKIAISSVYYYFSKYGENYFQVNP